MAAAAVPVLCSGRGTVIIYPPPPQVNTQAAKGQEMGMWCGGEKYELGIFLNHELI